MRNGLNVSLGAALECTLICELQVTVLSERHVAQATHCALLPVVAVSALVEGRRCRGPDDTNNWRRSHSSVQKERIHCTA